MNNVLYSAVVLDELSKQRLIKIFRKLIPINWTIYCHHMTLNMGAIDPKYAQDLGKTVKLIGTEYAIDDKVMALKVVGFNSKNATPHITIAVNRKNGGKPVMSNYLTNWKKLPFSLNLSGVITEILKNGR